MTDPADDVDGVDRRRTGSADDHEYAEEAGDRRRADGGDDHTGADDGDDHTGADGGDDRERRRQSPTSLESEADLDRFLDGHEFALVEFYTEGCGVCASMEPVLGIVARASEAAVATVNPRDDPPLVERFEIRGVPTLVLFVAGEEVARLNEGFVGADDLLAFVDEHAPDRGSASGDAADSPSNRR
jgi:thiol-disulfide isomerase/thioredoxin